MIWEGWQVRCADCKTKFDIEPDNIQEEFPRMRADLIPVRILIEKECPECRQRVKKIRLVGGGGR